MSQQINLLLPELLPRRDWLDLRWIGLASLLLLLLFGALAWQVQRDLRLAEASRQAVQTELEHLQKMVGDMNRTLTERKPDPQLVAEVQRQKEAMGLRQVALQMIDQGRAGNAQGYAHLMGGFSRQVMEGVWLTGFEFVGKDIEIRGRLRDYSLLPAYIRRLNAEEAFRAYRFSALDMKGVDPKEDKAEKSAVSVTPAGSKPAQAAFTEFTLRSSEKELAP